MIILNKINKKYKESIINDLSYKFSDAGLYTIIGDSGSGKSTLLNIISGLDLSYLGDVIIDGINLKELSETEREKFRLTNIGYLFQDFKLINLLNAEDNIIFNLDASSKLSKNKIKGICLKILDKLNLKHKKRSLINNLSGGEKQRIALARALVNEPKYLLCDEPSGNLDNKTADDIFKILKEYSKNHLVIVVSHDLEIAKKFSDILLYFKDGQIYKEEIINIPKKIDNNIISYPKKDTPILSLSLCLKTGLGKIKEKKFRSIFTNLITSFSLLALGIGIIISTSLRNEITSSFSSVISSNEILVTNKNNISSSYTSYIATEEDRVREIRNKYSDYFYGDGISYLNDFNTLFPTYDKVYIQYKSGKKIYLDTFHSTLFANYVWKEEKVIKKFYPSFERDLDLYEVILGLTYQDMVNLCINLQINRTFEDLGNYLASQQVMIGMGVANDLWSYQNDEYFRLVSVYQNAKSEVMHTNHYFNEYIFEGDMQLPSTRELESDPTPPWTLKKVHTLHCLESPSELIDIFSYVKEYDDLLFERKENINFDSCIFDDTCSSNVIYVFTLDKNSIDISDIVYFKKVIGDIESYYFSSILGYQMHESGMLEGFVNNIAFTFDEEKAIEVGDYFSKEIEGEMQDFDGVAIGALSKYNNNGVLFSNDMSTLSKGRKPDNYNEIVVSSGLLNYLGMTNEDPLYKELFYSTYNALLDSVIIDNFKIVGVIENDKNYIYHNPLFTISFFRDKLGISSFNLIPTMMVLHTSENIDINDAITLLNSSFKKYNFTSPLLEIGKTVDEVMNYVETISLAFSFITLLITIMLLALIFYLNLLESKNEINLLKHLGHNNKTILLYVLSHSLVMAFITTILSLVEIMVFQFMLSMFLGNYFGSNMVFTFNIIPYFVVLIVGISLPILISFLITYFSLNKKKR